MLSNLEVNGYNLLILIAFVPSRTVWRIPSSVSNLNIRDSLKFLHKSIALNSVDDVDVGGFDDELSAIEIAYLAKNFRNFLKNNNRRTRDKNTAEPRSFRKNDPTKVNNIDEPRERVGQSSNNSMGLQCFGCQGYSHIKSECPTYLKSKGL